MSGVDWSTTAGCAWCNEYGPFEAWDAEVVASRERARDIHQALHVIAAAGLAPLVPLALWLGRCLSR